MKLKIIDEAIRDHLPKRSTEGSAAFDLRACIQYDELVMHPNETVLVPTGVAIHIDNPFFCGLILPRSGMGSEGLILGNGTGLLDSDYQGELKVCLWNRHPWRVWRIKKLDRIAQLVVLPLLFEDYDVVEEFPKSNRGTKGFGSTGRD